MMTKLATLFDSGQLDGDCRPQALYSLADMLAFTD
jgi:hypothetical protein